MIGYSNSGYHLLSTLEEYGRGRRGGRGGRGGRGKREEEGEGEGEGGRREGGKGGRVREKVMMLNVLQYLQVLLGFLGYQHFLGSPKRKSQS